MNFSGQGLLDLAGYDAYFSSSLALINPGDEVIIPGSVFSKRNVHVRISFAASVEMLLKGIEILNRIA